MQLKNVKLSWVKLDPNNPDLGFDKKTPQYSVAVTTDSKEDANAYTKAGIKFKPEEVEGKIVYTARLKKKIWTNADGKNDTPAPFVVDKNLEPFTNVTSIGNGTTANVQVRFKPYDFQGNKGISVILVGIQIVNLVEYVSGNEMEFTAIDTDKEVI